MSSAGPRGKTRASSPACSGGVGVSWYWEVVGTGRVLVRYCSIPAHAVCLLGYPSAIGHPAGSSRDAYPPGFKPSGVWWATALACQRPSRSARYARSLPRLLPATRADRRTLADELCMLPDCPHPVQQLRSLLSMGLLALPR